MKKRIITLFLTLILICSLTFISKGSLSSFTDIPDNEWFAESVEYVKDNGLMNGVTVTTFEPATCITRGMIVTIIYRLEGSPKVNSELKFSDVNPTYYYCTPIIWASENGIVNGYSKGVFAPDDEITREQFATILYRYAEKKGIDVSFDAEKVNLSNYEDVEKISDYAVNAISWANETGLIKGVTVTTLEPQGKATRAQAATIFMRFDKLIEQSEQTDSSSEVKEDDNKQSESVKNDNSSPNKDSGSKEEHVDKDDVNTGGDNNDDDKNAGEWDDVKDEKPKDENSGDDSSKDEPTKDDPVEDDEDNEKEVYDKPTIAVESVSANAGEEASVRVELHNNPGILGMTLKLEFDEEAMTLTEVEKGTALSETTFTAPKGEALKNGCQFLWDAEYVSPEDVTNGNILKLTFEIADTAEIGDYDVTLSYNNGAVIDNDMLPINLEITNGKISIK